MEGSVVNEGFRNAYNKLKFRVAPKSDFWGYLKYFFLNGGSALIDFDISIIIAGLLLLSIASFYLKKKKNKDFTYILFYFVFNVYLLYVLKYTIFPIPVYGPPMEEVMGKSNFFSHINFIPFNFESIYYLFSMQVLGNVILSIPFGFGIPYVIKFKKSKLYLVAIFFGMVIELIQLCISLLLGFAYRTIDINDVIFNFLGVIIGFYLFKLFSAIYIIAVRKMKIELNDNFLKYIYEVAKSNLVLGQTQLERVESKYNEEKTN